MTPKEEVAPEPVKVVQPKVENKKLFVSGMPPSISEEHLAKHFSKYGTVTHCVVVRNKDTGISRGFGFVTYGTVHEAEGALALEKHVVEGRQLKVQLSAQDGTQYSNKG